MTGSNSPCGGHSASCSLAVKGRVRVHLVQNVSGRHFSGRRDLSEAFWGLRGGSALAEAIRKVETSIGKPFSTDPDAVAAQENGYDMGVFTPYVLRNEFMPSYSGVRRS